MSHFSVVVHVPAGNDNLLVNEESYLEEIMIPWHEYECTGIINEYVYHNDITQDVIASYLKMQKAFYNPSIKRYYFSYSFDNEQLIKRELTEEEKEHIYDITYGSHDVRIERDEDFNPKYMLTIPESYIETQAAACHIDTILKYVEDNFGINTIISNPADIPETGPYVLISSRMKDIGPFDIETPLQDIKNLLTESIQIFEFTNPNAKWDWWTVGGRFGLISKDGKACYKGKIKDLSFINQKNANAADIIWRHLIDGENNFEKDIDLVMLCWGYTKEYLQQFPSKEAWIEDYSKWRPYAYIKDGKWYEPGRMGWFGCSSATAEGQTEYNQDFDEMIKQCNPEDWLICVDCHI